jgi:hypothetical protein
MHIPLHAGGTWATPGEVVAYAEIDPEDYEVLGQLRWRLSPDGYAVRTSHASGLP